MTTQARKKAARPAPKELLKHSWKPGQSGNPKGRPKGCRDALGRALIEALNEDFQKHGKKAVETVRIEKPDKYLQIIAATLPKEFNVNTNAVGDLSDDELAQLLDAVRGLLAASPDAALGKRDKEAVRH